MRGPIRTEPPPSAPAQVREQQQGVRGVRFDLRIPFYWKTLLQVPSDIGDPQRTALGKMKMGRSIQRLCPLRGGIEEKRPIPSAGHALALLADWLERALPDMAQIGVGMLIVAACVASGWIDLGMDEATTLAMQQGQEAAAAGMPGYVPF